MSSSWGDEQKIFSSDIVRNKNFGESIAIHGNYAVVGAERDSYDFDGDPQIRKSGAAYILKKNSDGTWSEQVKIYSSDITNGHRFGQAVDIYDNYAIISQQYDDEKGTRTGAAYIFKKDDNSETWSQQNKLLPTDAAASDSFSFDVSMYDNYVAISKGGQKGIYIFKKDNNAETWSEQTKLSFTGRASSDLDGLGQFISMYNNYIAVSAKMDNYNASITRSGAVYILKKNSDETWSQQAKLRPSDSVKDAWFGSSISMYENYVIIGESKRKTNNLLAVGAAYIFKKDDGAETWSQIAKLISDDPLQDEEFGSFVSMYNNYAVIGSEVYNRIDKQVMANSIYDIGAAWIFKKTVDQNNNETWSLDKKLDVATQEDDNFGSAVSIYGNNIVIGARGISVTTDMNGGTGEHVGAAYVYTLTGEDNTGVAEKAAAEKAAATTNLKDILLVAEAIINKMTTDITVINSEISITTEIKNSMIKTSGGQKETKTNIRKKRREFFKILFADNLSESKIKMNSADIGLDETLKDTLGSRTVKEKVTVLKKNESTPIDVSTETSADTGIYAELDTLNDSVVFDVGVANKNVTVTKTQNADSNSGAVDQWTINYDNVDYVKEEGETLTVNGYTIYIGSVYIDGDNAGIPTDGSVYDLKSFKIPFAADNNPNITSFSSNEKIREDRHTVLAQIFGSETETKFLTNSSDLGLDQTVGKPVKPLVTVYSANSEVDLGDAALITKNRGVYGDLSGVGDYIEFTAPNNNSFRVVVTSEAPNKRYMFKTTAGEPITGQTIQWRDGQWATYNNVTFYFGGVMTNGTNDGITAADPYVFPINGNPYKLPDRNANYCLYADENTFITGLVRQLPLVEQNKMRQWVIEKLGSDTNNGAELVTDGFFYSAIHVNTNIGELYLDLETKVCNTTNKGMFNVSFKNTRDNTELFKGEHKTTATISWNDNGNTIAVDVDFFENPQIRNGIRMNTVMTKSEPIGLLIEDYEPNLLRVKNPKNKLNKYERLLNKLELGQRVEGEKLNLQKEGEVWTRHKM